MKQKGFLITLLALAVVISLSAGSLAIYASAADVAASQAGTRSFDLAAPVAVDVRPTVAPMQTASFPFEVSGSSLGQVDAADAMDLTVFFGSTDALAQTPGLYACLVETTGGGRRVLKTVVAGDLRYEEPLAFTGDETRTFAIELSWLDDSAAATARLSACQLFVTGAPHTEG